MSGLNKKITWQIAATYKFFTHENPEQHLDGLRKEADRLGVRGIFVLAEEGLNTTSAAPDRRRLDAWIQHLEQRFGISLDCKFSESEKTPFRRLALKLRPEICTTGNTELVVDESLNNHLTPAEWDRMIAEEDPVLIDTRNDYEYELGTFRNALNPHTGAFSEFFDRVDEMKIPADKPILIFCTGGIRCHKGIYELQRRGYRNVYQLQGGILNYLKEHSEGQSNWQGSCFVFDHRVAVGDNLQPVEGIGLCTHCGNPASETVDCHRCDGKAYVCENCRTDSIKGITCSKDCANHWAERPGQRSRRRKSGELAHRM